ncbi:MAG: biotin/lipoyl-containing protein [Planctomycetota bacterium]
MKLRLTIDGKEYEVDVEVLDEGLAATGPAQPVAPAASSASAASAARPAAAPAAKKPAGSGGAVDEAKALRSPISGVVVRVEASVGQAVKQNDVLLVVEAMKMETVITSQIDGKVAAINAGPGDAVQVKQVLVEFE